MFDISHRDAHSKPLVRPFLIATNRNESREAEFGGQCRRPISRRFSLPGRVSVGWRVSEAMEGFVTTLPRMSGARDDLRQRWNLVAATVL